VILKQFDSLSFSPFGNVLTSFLLVYNIVEWADAKLSHGQLRTAEFKTEIGISALVECFVDGTTPDEYTYKTGMISSKIWRRRADSNRCIEVKKLKTPSDMS